MDKPQRTTDTLQNELCAAPSITQFLAANAAEMNPPALPTHLMTLLRVKNLKKADLARRSGLERTYVYHILSGDKRPSREKLLALALALHLSVEEAQRLLKYAGKSTLYARRPFDCAVIYALTHAWSVPAANELLSQLRLNLLA